MPTLDWLDREHAFRIAERVPTRVLRPHTQAPAVVGDAALPRATATCWCTATSTSIRWWPTSRTAAKSGVAPRRSTIPPKVARWVRNLDSDPVSGFWLPTSFRRFYPDFVCELTDGRLLVVEYKGAQIASMPKEIEKGEVGKLWAARSGGRCVFALVLKDRDGLDVTQQLDAAIS